MVLIHHIFSITITLINKLAFYNSKNKTLGGFIMEIKALFSSILVCFLVLGLTGFNPLGFIRSDEPVRAGQELEMHVNLNNDLEEYAEEHPDRNVDMDLDNVRVHAYIIDSFDDVVLYSNNIEIDKGEKSSAWLFWEIPEDVPEGDYLVRVVANGDGFKDVDYTWVSVY